MALQSQYAQELKRHSITFENGGDLAPLIKQLATKKVVMLGESSHGTHEFYQWRSLISQKLIIDHGFDFIAVEGDWPACQKVNEFIQGQEKSNARAALSNLNRWPTWMWANTEMIGLIDEIYTQNCDFSRNIGFHGMDVYSFYESMDEVVKKLDQLMPELAMKVRDYYSCMSAFSRDEMTYARSLFKAPEGCKDEIIGALQDLLTSRIGEGEHSSAFIDVIQNARIVKNAENY